MSNPNSTQARLMVEKSKATAQDKILVVDVTDCLYCTNLAKLLRENLERKGLRATSRAVQESEILDKKNFKDLSGFSKIFVPALEISTADVVAALWDGNSTAEFWAGDGVGSMGRYLKALPFAKSLRVRWIANYHPDIAVAENRLFVKEFKKVHGNPPIDTSAFSYEALRYVALELIQRKPINKWLTGSVVMKPRHAVRAMPIMTLRDGESKLLELARP
jgi:hypothetical protein